jgi:hypothetical protein
MIRFDLLGGGAIGAVAPDATTFVHRSSLVNTSIIARWMRDEETDAKKTDRRPASIRRAGM